MKGLFSLDASGALAQKKNHSVITHNAILITRVSESLFTFAPCPPLELEPQVGVFSPKGPRSVLLPVPPSRIPQPKPRLI